MKALLLALVFLASRCLAASPAAQARIEQIIAELERTAAESKDRHPLETREADRRMRALLPEIRAMGPEAVTALGATLGEPEKPLKARLYAAAFLGLHGDPSAFKPLRDCALDVFDNPGLRSAALQALATVRVGPVQRHRVLEKALDNEAVPPAVRTEALDQLAELGAGDPRIVVQAASLPDLRAQDARNAARAIAKSKDSGAAAAMILLLPHLRNDPDAEVEALAGLLELPRAGLSPDERGVLIRLLRRREGKAAAWAARALGKLRAPEAADELRRSLRGAKDPLVVTESAEALAKLRDPKGAKEIAGLAERLSQDRRFTTATGEDIPTLAARIHAAAAEARSPVVEVAAAEPVPQVPAPPPAETKGPAYEQFGSEDVRRGAFRCDGYPGDSRPAVRWPGGKARLYERPEPDAPSRKAKLPAGELAWDASVVWTLEAGEAVARRPLTLQVEDLGRFTGRYSGAPGQKREVRVAKGERLALLGVRGGGDCFVRRRQRLIVMECPHFFPGPYEIERLPVVEWWIRVEGGWMTTEYERAP